MNPHYASGIYVDPAVSSSAPPVELTANPSLASAAVPFKSEAEAAPTFRPAEISLAPATTSPLPEAIQAQAKLEQT